MASHNDDNSPPSKRQRTAAPSAQSEAQCPYISTVNNRSIDFDLRPICSVTLKSDNLYICLSCGRYLHGRKPSTPANNHSLQTNHHLFINYHTEQVWCLPDDYLVQHDSLNPIRDVLRPKYSREIVANLDRIAKTPTNSKKRGIVPLQRLQATNYANATVHLFLRPSPLRDFLLLSKIDTSKDLPSALAELCRKIWAANSFRVHCSPHRLMHLLAVNPKFSLLERPDPLDLLNHLFNTLHPPRKTTPPSTPLAKLLAKCYRGQMEVVTTPVEASPTAKTINFWYLPVDLPPQPLFRHSSDQTLVPQVKLEDLLAKYDGFTAEHVLKTGANRTYSLLQLPDYLILVLRRFTKSKFGVEKNPAVAHLPEILDMSHLCEGDHKYSLMASVAHQGTYETGDFFLSLLHQSTNSWYKLADATSSKTQFPLVSLAPSYLLLYQRIQNS